MYACSINAVVTNLFRALTSAFMKDEIYLLKKTARIVFPVWGLLFSIFISDALIQIFIFIYFLLANWLILKLMLYNKHL